MVRVALRAFWAVLRKDIHLFWRSPAVVAVTLLPPLLLLVTLLMEGAAVGSLPVALVDRDGGAAAAQVSHALSAYPGFRAEALGPVSARAAFQQLRVAGVLTIPAGFSRAAAGGRRPAIALRIRNFNADFTNDLRRDLPDALRSVEAASGSAAVAVRERDLRPADADFLGFQMIAILVLLLLQAGIVNAGMAAVQEWQSGTVKEILLAPAPAMAAIAGKVLAGVVAADLVGLALAGLSLAAGFFRIPTAGQALWALLAMTLLGALGSGIGVGLASALRSFERLGPVSILLSFYLFFLAGGIAAIAFLPGWLRAVARVVPNTYAMDALRGLLLYGAAPGLGTDLAVLAVWTVAVLAAGPWLLRRSLSR